MSRNSRRQMGSAWNKVGSKVGAALLAAGSLVLGPDLARAQDVSVSATAYSPSDGAATGACTTGADTRSGSFTAPTSGVLTIRTSLASDPSDPGSGTWSLRDTTSGSTTEVGGRLGEVGSLAVVDGRTYTLTVSVSVCAVRDAIAATGSAIGTFVPSQPAPANDLFSNGQILTGESGSVNVSTVGATQSSNDPYTLGRDTVWYRYRSTTQGRLDLRVVRSTFDAQIGVYLPEAYGGLSEVGFSRALRPSLSRVSLLVQPNTVYSIAIAGDVEGSAVLAYGFTPLATPPNDRFAQSTLLPGASGSLGFTNVGASVEDGEPEHSLHSGFDSGRSSSVWFTWVAPATGTVRFSTGGATVRMVSDVYFGMSIPELVRPDLNFLTYSRSGNNPLLSFPVVVGRVYRIALDSDVDGQQGSGTLNWNFTPVNDVTPQVLFGLSGSVRATNEGATAEVGERRHLDPTPNSVWFSYRAPQNGVFSVRTSAVAFDTVLAVYEGSKTGRRVALDDDAGGGLSSSLSFVAVAGRTYFIALDSFGDNTGRCLLSYALQASATPANDLFARAANIAGSRGSVAGYNIGAGSEAGEPLHLSRPALASVWYRWQAPSTGTFTFSARGLALNPALAFNLARPRLAIYTGTALSGLRRVATASAASEISSAALNATAGTVYFIAVDAEPDLTGRFNLVWQPVAPGTRNLAGPSTRSASLLFTRSNGA